MRRMTLSMMLSLAAGVALAAPPANSEWPKGIDPATLLPNTDPEPDLGHAGFVDLFNGEDLSGWSVQGGAMAFEAKDGVVVGTCVKGEANGFLCTDKTYSDFVFTAEFRWEVLGNSGVMFRAGMRDQGNTEAKRVFGYQSEMDQNERRWTGGIYGEAMGGWKYPLSKPEGHAAARAAIEDHSAWNRMTILADGPVMKTWINGVPCSHLINEERSEGIIGLQVHGGPKGTVNWRNIRIKELNAFTDLFADGTFAKWSAANGTDVGSKWSIEDGVAHFSEKGAGSIVTRDPYKDFELTFDWKISKGGNSGVKYRTHRNLGPEYQILDDANNQNGKKPLFTAGSLYDLVGAPGDKPLRPAGEWNTSRIVARGTLLEHWLNGVKIVQIDQDTDDWQQRFEKSKYRDLENFGAGAGPILLQEHGDEAWYRNVRIRDLTSR